jgi:hypothetical protein
MTRTYVTISLYRGKDFSSKIIYCTSGQTLIPCIYKVSHIIFTSLRDYKGVSLKAGVAQLDRYIYIYTG